MWMNEEMIKIVFSQIPYEQVDVEQVHHQLYRESQFLIVVIM